ncbi:MAG TPA: translation initiation factor IF-2, partial [Ktedonobacteraceae bacterium]
MRDTTDFTDATEQAPKKTTKPRNTARSQSESAASGNQQQTARAQSENTAPGNQQQEEKTAPRRRTPSTTTQRGTTPAQPRSGNTQTRSSNTQTRSGNTQTRSSNTQARSSNTQAPHGPTRSSGAQTRPADVPTRNGNGPSRGQHPQRSGGSHSPSAGGGGSRTFAPQRGSSPQRPGQQRPNGQSHGGPGSTATRPRPGGGRTRSTQGHRSASSTRSAERRALNVKEKRTGPVTIPPQIVVKDLAELLDTTPTELIKTLIKHGVFASINQVVDYEKAALAATDLGFEPNPGSTSENGQGDHKLSANEAMIASRNNDSNTIVVPPVVTIMGHVDHGKTSLLDVIRKTKVAAGEAGGITQHIGAYQVEINGKKITFLDTPGHEAFTAMRARGAQATHIAIIVVAADDGVMPQTREAIDHARAAKVPIIIALNKIDKANANPDRVKQQLSDINVVVEEYGGDTVCVPVSARKAQGIDELLEMILLVAEMQDIRANPNRLATGIIIEAKLERNSGPTATVLVQQGTLKMGDTIVVGTMAGKVRAMFNDRGKRIQKAPPSTPVSILGLPEVPEAGDHLEAVPDERTAKQHAQVEAERRASENLPLGQVSLDTLYMQMQEGTVKELNVVLKTDVQGSAEAIKGSLSKLGEENRKVRLIREGTGNVSENDVHLAAASRAIILAFNVKADGPAQSEAQREKVDIHYYDVIYKLIEDIEAALTGMLEPTYREVIDGHAEVLQTFKAGKSVVAGCRITDGKITRSASIRVMRKGEKVHEGHIASLRRGKDDVREVATGYECGILL